jgi:hypothetical protein
LRLPWSFVKAADRSYERAVTLTGAVADVGRVDAAGMLVLPVAPALVVSGSKVNQSGRAVL